MAKQIKELTRRESVKFCDNRRDNNTTSKPYNACVDCPLRWARQCIVCIPIMPQSLVTRMYKAIGNRCVEV